MSNPEVKKKSFVFKLLLIFTILSIPIILIMIIFSPFRPKKQEEKYKVHYQLKKNFLKKDIEHIVKQMKGDREFHNYFKWLTQKRIDDAIDEVYGILDQHRDKKQLYQKMMQMQEKVESLAFAFNSLDYSDDFYNNPMEYPALYKTLWIFLYEEFKISVIGICYKVRYDLNFQFQWDAVTKQAAGNWIIVIQNLKKQ